MSDGVATIAAAVVAAVAATFAAFFGRSASKQLALQQAAIDRERDQDQARLDYEYEARKRLYETYEPVRFQLVDAIGQALRRISQLSQHASASGSKHSSADSRAAEVYELLAPLAWVRILDRTLTLLDMGRDPSISAQYSILKSAYRLLTEDLLVAAVQPPVTYDRSSPAPQGLSPRDLDRAVDALVVSNDVASSAEATAGLPLRVASFTEYRRLVEPPSGAEDCVDFDAVFAVLDGFSPDSRPVLWRMLVIQVLLYGLYLYMALSLCDPKHQGVQAATEQVMNDLRSGLAHGLRLDRYWAITPQPDHPTEVNSRAVLAELDPAVEYFTVWIAPALSALAGFPLGHLRTP